MTASIRLVACMLRPLDVALHRGEIAPAHVSVIIPNTTALVHQLVASITGTRIAMFEGGFSRLAKNVGGGNSHE